MGLIGRVPSEPVNKKRDASFYFYGRIIAEFSPRFGNIGAGERHITRLRRKPFDQRFPSYGQLQQINQPVKLHCFRLTQVENLIAKVPLSAGDDALKNVIDKGVIARRGTVAKNGNGLAGLNQRREFMNREIWPLSRSVHCEEPQHHNVQPMEVMIDMSQRLTSQFACSVRRDRARNRVIFRKWDFRIDAVDRRRRGNGDFPNQIAARRLQQIDGSFDIHALVHRRLFQTGAYTRTRSEMNDLIKSNTPQKLLEAIALSQVCLNKPEGAAESFNFP